MLNQLGSLVANLASRWRELPSSQKILLGSLGAGIVLTVVITTLVVNHVSYAVLYAGLDAGSASRVVESLKENKVPFRLEDSGKTVLVPESQVYSVRLELAGEDGMPASGSGYEIFDKSKFGMTSFMQQVNYRRALEGEITRTIREMDEVLAARVHLVIPERKLFNSDRDQTSASVMVRIRPGSTLSQAQLAGITSLVSGSVEGLDPGNVNVIDYLGNLLTAQTSDQMNHEGNGRLDMETTFAERIEFRAQSLLDRVVGPGNAVVRVAAELDHERSERELERFDPENSVVRSEEIQEESDGGDAGGNSRNSVTNYEINRTVERLVTAPGNVRRLTIAVSVSGTHAEPAAGANDAEPLFVPRSEAELADLAALVKNAVGFDGSRGDQFHIASVEFDRSYWQEEQAELRKTERALLWVRIGEKFLIFAIVAVAGFFLFKLGRSFSAALLTAARPAPMPSQPAQTPNRSAEEEISRTASVINEVSEMARAKPNESASVLREMIAGEE